MYQEQADLEAELSALEEKVDGAALRAAFVEAAGRYAESKGLQRAAFKQMGIDAATLTEAGIR